MLDPQKMAPDINTPSGASIWQRSRIIAKYKNNDFETKFSFQDVRPFTVNKYGNAGAFAASKYWMSASGSQLGVHEAWAKYYLKNDEDFKMGIKIGRQELKNSDGRLLWNRNWNHYGAAFDAIAFEGRNKKFDLDWDLVWALNSVDAPYMATTPFRHMAYFEVRKGFGDIFTLNFIDMLENVETGLIDTAYNRNTIGVNPVFKTGGLKVEGSFYTQMGLAGYVGDGSEITNAGMMYAVSASYKVSKFTFKAGYDSYSGEAYDDDQSDNKNKTFTALCCAGHKFFGNADFHLRYGKTEGLTDMYLTANGGLSKKTKVMAGLHMISFTSSPGLNSDGDEIKTLGNNIDFVVIHKPAKKVSLKVGYSVMLPSADFTEMTLGIDTDAKFHGWGWLTLTFKPSFM